MNEHADLDQEEHIRIVKAVARMRRADRYAMLLIGILTMLSLGVFFVFVTEDVDLLFGMLLGLTLICAVAYMKSVKLACPGCGMALTPPGKFTGGTLNKRRCEGCGVSFEMDMR
jgi:hypothetical protein